MTAILVLGVSTTAFAYAEKYTVYGNELHQIVELDTNAIISFKGDPNALRGFEIYNKSLAPNTTNCQSGYGNGEYSVCIFETKNMALGYHEWVDRTTNTWGKFYIHQAVEVDTESNTSEEVSKYAKDFKAQIELKITEKLKPLQKEITDLKLQLSNANAKEVSYQKQIATAQDNVVKAQANILELQNANATIEQYKKEADNWKAVALEQLRVMVEVLGLLE